MNPFRKIAQHWRDALLFAPLDAKVVDLPERPDFRVVWQGGCALG
jgi:hypothetical protein